MGNKIRMLFKMITFHPDILFKKAIKAHKKYRDAKKHNNKFLMLYYGFFANRYATKYNLELYGESGNNLKIWHGNIIINSEAKLGNNVQLHGNNCIGNKIEGGKSPKIGDNVEIGFGSVILGNIEIADNVIIGANSLVNKSILEKNVIVAGVPAKIIGRCLKNEKDNRRNK